jgi:hypothetical protein
MLLPFKTLPIYPIRPMMCGEIRCNKRLLSPSGARSRSLPASLKLRRNETIIGVDTVELTFGQCGGIAPALELPNQYNGSFASAVSRFEPLKQPS